MLMMIWAWPWGCMSPPITPNDSHGWPPRAKPGMIVWNGRLPGAIDVGVAVGQGEQLAPVLEHEAQAVRRQARAHAAIVGLDDR
jgi:hypothetical protein